MDAPQPKPREHYYRPELDVLRFLAFSLVFINHTFPIGPHARILALFPRLGPIIATFAASGGFGVSVFFVLSAFLLCELLHREKAASGTVHVGQFYLRRIARIWPLYYLVLALGAIAALVPGSAPNEINQIGWYAIFMAPLSVVRYGWVHNPIFPLWSISIEERFYLFIPWLLRIFSRKMLLAVSIALIGAANLRLLYLGNIRATDDSIWVDSIAQSQCFAVGLLLSLVLNGRLPSFRVGTRLLIFACGILCFMGAMRGILLNVIDLTEVTYSGSWTLVGRYFLVTSGALLLLLAFLGAPGSLFPKWAIYLGRISYGLYAFHSFPMALTSTFNSNPGLNRSLFQSLQICFGFAATVALAALSFKFIETPFIRLRKRHAFIESQPD